MSIGLSLLRAAIEGGSATTIRQASIELFLPDEHRHYEFVRGHMRRYGRLPSLETCQQAGLQFPRITETADFYDNQVRNRAMFNRITQDHPALMEAMRTRNMEAAREALKTMLVNANAFSTDLEVTTIVDEARAVMDEYNEVRNSFGGLRGVTLGWDVLDTITQGAQPGDVIVVVGRPNQGKTYKLIHMLKQAWLRGSTPLFTSMEMTTQQVARRLIAMTAGVNPDFIRNGRLSTVGHNQVIQTIDGFEELPPLHLLSGNFRRKVSDIDNLCQQFQPDIIYIDAGYLLAPERQRRQNSRREQISDVLEELKALAVERKRPVVVSVQFNREASKIGDKKNLDVSQIGETDVIGQIATVVIGIRPGLAPFEKSRRRVEVIKNRDGELLNFTTRFSFAPMDFGFLAEEEAAAPITEQNTGWML